MNSQLIVNNSNNNNNKLFNRINIFNNYGIAVINVCYNDCVRFSFKIDKILTNINKTQAS